MQRGYEEEKYNEYYARSHRRIITIKLEIDTLFCHCGCPCFGFQYREDRRDGGERDLQAGEHEDEKLEVTKKVI
jgi:hypothetical protein